VNSLYVSAALKHPFETGALFQFLVWFDRPGLSYMREPDRHEALKVCLTP
jgi:hypothetical protein